MCPKCVWTLLNVFIVLRTQRTPAKIEEVRVALQADEQLEVGDPARQTARRNNAELTKSTFNRITKKELKLQCYVPGKGVTAEPGDALRRLQMSNSIIPYPFTWVQNSKTVLKRCLEVSYMAK